MSNIDELLCNSLSIDGKQHYIHGDALYSLRPWSKDGGCDTSAKEERRIFNAFIIAVREAVEFNYEETKLYFTSQVVKRKLKCREAAIVLKYIFGNRLLNFTTCLGDKA